MAEAIDIRSSDNHDVEILGVGVEMSGGDVEMSGVGVEMSGGDVEMSGVGVETPPFLGQAVARLVHVGDNPILSPNDAEMATEDDFNHIFSDISEIDLGDPTSDVQDSIIDIDNYVSEQFF